MKGPGKEPGRETLVVPGESAITYGSYLKVNELLSLQSPLSTPAEHDETLFIVIHQVYELWFKQILHEVQRAQLLLRAGQLMPFLRTLHRVVTIQHVLTKQIDVLETMTPVDFNRFRERLNPASGFQSFQFRELEFRLGAKDTSFLRFHKLDAKATQALTEALAAPTLYDEFLRLLKKRGFDVPGEVLERDVKEPYHGSEKVRDVVLEIYRNSEKHHDLYSALEALVDVDEGIVLWRYRHVAMVERMIGTRKGTGGSSGVKYLSQTLTKRFFPELWEARNWMGGGDYGQ